MTEEMSFPAIEFLQERTRQIIADSDQASVTRRLEHLFAYYKVINFEFGSSGPLWRARKCTSAIGYDNLRDLSHPPPELTRTGRLNNASSPLLYASFNKFTAFSEVEASEGDYLHIVGYSILPTGKLRCAIVGEVFSTHRSGSARVSKKLSVELNRLLNVSDYRAARSWVFLDAFLADLLRDRNADANDYFYTRAIADLIFRQVKAIDAIYYPSVVLENGVNVAVKPEAAARLLGVMGTSVIRINRIFDYGIYDFQVVRNSSGFSCDGTIRWKDQAN